MIYKIRRKVKGGKGKGKPVKVRSCLLLFTFFPTFIAHQPEPDTQ